MEAEERMIAVCGIDCTACEIRKVPIDDEAAERVAGWFREMGWLEEDEGVAEIIERSMYCKGCREDRSIHWSANCEILHCCVDEKGLSFCCECDEFVCRRLEEWAQQGDQYARALDRLRSVREGMNE